mmetsp:Transcript_25561/g.64849  ORF Transcript_25561/g.64849 Transcript_25561/m.64849 type:complete len:290 (-) Transcript_25561:429-1298(-)
MPCVADTTQSNTQPSAYKGSKDGSVITWAAMQPMPTVSHTHTCWRAYTPGRRASPPSCAHLASYQVSADLQSTASSTRSGRPLTGGGARPSSCALRIHHSQGLAMCATTSCLASSACALGPSRMTSSCTCMMSLNPSAFRRGHLSMATMADDATSAADPWMGVLMAARSACPFLLHSSLLMSGSGRRRPRMVDTKGSPASLRARSRVSSCHACTSLRSAYHLATVSLASSRLVPKSLARPCAVLPYAMEKLRILALRRSLAYLSLSCGRSSLPFSFSIRHVPASTSARM